MISPLLSKDLISCFASFPSFHDSFKLFSIILLSITKTSVHLLIIAHFTWTSIGYMWKKILLYPIAPWRILHFLAFQATWLCLSTSVI